MGFQVSSVHSIPLTAALGPLRLVRGLGLEADGAAYSPSGSRAALANHANIQDLTGLTGSLPDGVCDGDEVGKPPGLVVSQLDLAANYSGLRIDRGDRVVADVLDPGRPDPLSTHVILWLVATIKSLPMPWMPDTITSGTSSFLMSARRPCSCVLWATALMSLPMHRAARSTASL